MNRNVRPGRGVAVPERESGFTLVEVMVSIALFAVVAALTTGFLISALQMSKQNSDRIQAANVARSQVEQLRALGTSRIDPGLTEGGPPGTPAAFTVRTTANWTTIGQTTSSCEAASTQPNFLRIHVEVTTIDLETPQVVDALLQPDIETTDSASVAIAVEDAYGAPVSDVRIQASDPVNPTNNFSYVTGDDGCLLIPNLIAPAVLTVTATRTGYVPAEETGTVQTVALEPLDVAEPPVFLLAPAAAVAFTAGSDDYPVPSAVPVNWQMNNTGEGASVASIGQSVNDLWPDPDGFTAWLGTCSDADPEAYAVPRTQYLLTGSATTHVDAESAPVFIRGLPADAPVTVIYAGPDPACASTTFAAGRTNGQGRLRIGLPFGLWRFDGGGEQHDLVTPLQPNADGTAQDPVRVDFTVADLDHMSPTPSPSPTPSGSPSGTPSGSPSP